MEAVFMEPEVEEEVETVDAKNFDWKPSPIETIHPETVEAGAIRLFREPAWRLRMTIEGDRSYTRVKVVRAAPLSEPDRYICFLDVKDEAICMVKGLAELREENHAIVREELDTRYLTAYVSEIVNLRNEYGVSYWDVETDRGRREFVAKNVAENAQWLGDTRLFILDVDGNRFEFSDLTRLDKRSRSLIDTVL
ncbi:TPA: hypothetical protein DCE37_22250 [Candidatus Latescibacteria bacterium]|nr:hypothetical protein [Candidatus Latescibacterota bacterium]|tara:strand:- start:118 stop:699 length:582 start_codon:yes stop_codon:yes gene_type:complete